MAKMLRSDGRRRNFRITTEQVKGLQASFRKGETLREAADKANCSPGTVYRWYQRFKEAKTS